ncbi:hypothetical protein I4U23_024132 [Adineta vaga]|nr:hypothetical protein I4U23_024132 [Adineta vaga]
MHKFIVLLTALILTVHVHYLCGLPVADEEEQNNQFKRSDDTLLPNGNYTLVTNEKLQKLKEVADAVHDPKLHELYRAVNHYVQIARKNNEYVLWKYDANQEGLVLVLKQNLNGILYYG